LKTTTEQKSLNNKRGPAQHHFSRKKNGAGFTIMELTVSVVIIALITAIVVYNQGDFSDQVALSNNVHEIEILVREAQVYGISVRESSPSSGVFSLAYGVDFNLLSGGGNNFIISFIDTDQNGYFTQTGQMCQPGVNECQIRYNITRNNTISSLNAIQSNDVLAPVSRIAFTYLRPNPAARFKFYNSGASEVTYPGHKGARITFLSPKGKTQNIYIYTTGEVQIQ